MNDAFAFFFFFCHHVRNQGRVPRDLRDLLDAEDQLFVRRERELEAGEARRPLHRPLLRDDGVPPVQGGRAVVHIEDRHGLGGVALDGVLGQPLETPSDDDALRGARHRADLLRLLLRPAGLGDGDRGVEAYVYSNFLSNSGLIFGKL